MNPMKQQSIQRQHGGTLVGFIVGVVVGLAGALAVAMYITKVPVPFLSKGQSRSPQQDAAEAKKNKDWDPNAGLYGKNPAKAVPPAMPGSMGSAATPSAPAVGTVPVKKADPKVITKVDPKGSASPDPLGDLVKAKSGLPEADPFTYFVQIGAYRTWEEAESQRAQLALSGIESKVSERQQSGRMVYRVRTGPFEKKEDGEKYKETLDKAGLEASLVRVQRATP
jgi:cell division protein FtsN